MTNSSLNYEMKEALIYTASGGFTLLLCTATKLQ